MTDPGDQSAPPLTADGKMALDEASVLSNLAQIKQELIALRNFAERSTQAQLSEQYDEQLNQLRKVHRQRKQQRDHDRSHYLEALEGDALADALSALVKQSQQDSAERRRLKHVRDQRLKPLSSVIAQADQKIRRLKLEYKSLSQAWQSKMQAAYLSSGAIASVPIVYQDDHLIVIDKLAGLLSVPGRRYHLQDSVLSRLRYQRPEQSFLQVVHRLDRDTSGLLAIAASPRAHRGLSQQFAQRQVFKQYEAILSRSVDRACGTIELPLWRQSPSCLEQVVDVSRGKPSKTDFRLLRSGEFPRVEFMPYTGRTHQLRVHAAHAEGLNAPILGDDLYGDDLYGKRATEDRLRLHATMLKFVHPVSQKMLCLSSDAPF